MTGQNKIKWSIVIAALLLSVILIIYFSTNNRIKSGVRIEGIKLSGYTKQEAIEKLNQIYSDKLDKSAIVLSYDKKIWKIPYKEINTEFDLDSAIEKAFCIGREGKIFSNILNLISALIIGRNIQVDISYDKSKLNAKVKELEKNINRAGKDAGLMINNDKIVKVIPEQPGLKLEVVKAVQLIEENISSASGEIIILPVKIEMPKYTAKQLNEINSQVGYSTTVFNTGELNRTINIKNALKRINGTILLPGELFSLNTALGPRNEENGYKNAPVILNDELVPGIGGGVCQVATTLYKSVLEGGFKVIERQHHTFPPAYVPIGQDATIAGSYIDFKFKNNSDYSLYIYAEVIKSNINIRLFSKQISSQRKVEIETQVLEVEDPEPDEIIQDSDLLAGKSKVEKKPQKGYKVSVYRNIYEGTEMVKREQVSNDYYKPIRGVIRIGTGVVEPDKDVMIKDFKIPEGTIEEPDNPPEAFNKLIIFN